MSSKSKKVGYKSPPASHRWKKGQSGNPSGKKKVLKVPPQPFLTAVTDQLQKPVEINQGGQISSVPLLTALVMKLCHEMMAAPLNQKLAALSVLAKLGVFQNHQDALEYAAAEEMEEEPIFTPHELALLKIIQRGGDLDDEDLGNGSL